MKAKRQTKPSSPRSQPRCNPAAPVSLLYELPLISCVMPTADHPEFVAQSVRLFQRQDYPARELIIVDDGTAVAGTFADDPRIRCLRLPAGLSSGRKRQYGCAQARGSILAHWDDDEWFGKERLSYQAGPLLSGEADISGLKPGLLLELAPWLFRACPEEAQRSRFRHAVDPRTLLFRRDVLDRLAHPDISSGEDDSFCEQALAAGARLASLPNEGLSLTILRDPRRAGAADWPEAPGLPLPDEDRSFYLQFSWLRRVRVGRSRNVARGRSSLKPNRPMVSCIMPTADRRPFVPHAIHCFLQQDYPECELIVVDDGLDPVADLIPANPAIRYFRLPARNTVGAKRNIACGYARGDIVLHWDDDDWSAPWRITYQVDRLLHEKADVCGLDRVLFAGPGPDRSYVYTYPKDDRPWVYGGTLCYRKEVWTRSPFPDTSVGEDNDFLWSGAEKKIAPLPDGTFYVGLIHGGNTSPKSTWDSRWSAGPPDQVTALLGAEWETYAALLSGRDATVATVEVAPRGHTRQQPAAALVALGAGIGDILRATPLIRVMHGLGYAVDVLIETDYPEVVSLFEGAPEIRRLFHRNSHWPGNQGERRERLDGLAETSYDVAVFPPWLPPHGTIVQTERRLHVQESEWWPHGVSHAIEKLAQDAGWVGALPPPLVVPSESRFDFPPDTVALHPGCKPDWPWKKWHGFDELAAALPEVVIIGQPSDLENHNTYFEKPFSWPPHARNLVGRLGLKDTAALLAQCRALVSNDSGMMHLGAAVGIPTFGIFGITSPVREVLPLPNLFPISKQLPCEPACRSLPARTDCEYHLRCLKTLTPLEVMARLDSLAPPRRARVAAAVAPAPAEPAAPVPAEWYDARYFESGGTGGWPDGYHWHTLGNAFRETAGFLTGNFQHAQVFLDAGCAKGFLVRSLRDEGKLCWGFDHSRCAIEHAVEPARPYLERAGVDDYVFGRSFDVLLAFDLLSHLTERQAALFLTRARYAIDACLLAVLPSCENGGLGRITVRSRQWWHELFLRAGWRQDFLDKHVERSLQAHPLTVRMNWDVYLYTP